MKKAFVILLGVFLLVLLVCVLLFYAFSNASEEYEQNQDTYFSKVSYHIEGRVIDYEYLGGVKFLLKIQVDTAEYNHANLGEDDNFIGVYDNENRIAYMVNEFDPPVDIVNEKIPPQSLPFIKVDSQTRQIFYSGKLYNDTVALRTTDVYKNDLIRIEKQLVTAFRF